MLVVGDHVWRYVFIVTFLSMCRDLEMLSSISTLAIRAHSGLFEPIIVYIFSHIIWIASFQAAMFSKCIPPSFAGLFSVLRLIEVRFPSHIESLIIFCSFNSISWSIPWTVVRYCVIPLANILTTSLQDMRVGCLWFHLLKVVSKFLGHIAALSMLLLTQPPSIQVPSFSLAIWVSSPRVITKRGAFRCCFACE